LTILLQKHSKGREQAFCPGKAISYEDIRKNDEMKALFRKPTLSFVVVIRQTGNSFLCSVTRLEASGFQESDEEVSF
jgi:hypothetical protein